MQLLFPASCFFRVLIAAREMHLVFQAAVSQSIIKCRAFHSVSKSPEKSTAFCTLLIIRQLKNDLHFPQVNRYAAIIGHLQSPMVHLPNHLPVILRIWTLFFLGLNRWNSACYVARMSQVQIKDGQTGTLPA